MKIIASFVLILLLLSNNLFAQPGKYAWNKPNYDEYLFHYGLAIGVNTLDFRKILSAGIFNSLDTVNAIEQYSQPGFNIHMVGNLRINHFLDLRFIPGMIFSQRDLTYHLSYLTASNDTAVTTHKMSIESTMLSFPLYIKYRANRINNWRPYILFGGNYTFDLETEKKIKEEEKPKIKLNKSDFYIEVGAGVDYYFPFFKLATELRFSFGINNMIKRDNTEYSNVFEKLNSKMVTLLIFVE